MIITSMIFFPDKTFYETPEDYHFSYEDVYFQTADGVKLHGWYLSAAQEKGVILFFHGNAGNISHRLFKMRGWIERGYSVFLVDYRGFGKSEGSIQHEKDVMEDARSALRWLLTVKKKLLSQIILYGESLGTHPAIQLAIENQAAALILEAPFTSFIDLARVHYPFIPKMLLKNFEFSNISWIDKIKVPLFILHGTRDEICPYSMGEELFKKAPEPKEFFSISGGDHNNLPASAGEEFWEQPYQFIDKHLTSH